MTELLCGKCGRPVDLIPIGPKGIAACRSCDSVLCCTRCGQFTVFFGGRPPDHPELASGVCSRCQLRERAEALPMEDVVAIRAAATIGVLPAVKMARERLGWSLQDAVSLVHLWGTDAEPGAAADGGGMSASPDS